MQQVKSFSGLKLGGSWVTIGVFDGVHLGHQHIIKNMVENAHQHDALAVIVSFHPHPTAVLQKIREPLYLTLPEERAKIFSELGVDYTITLDFGIHLAELSAREFVSELKNHLGMQQLWIGTDFALGKNRQGDVKLLAQLGQEFGFQLHISDPISASKIKISSSEIRKLILEGQVETANQLLGRNYTIQGKVIRGDGRGRKLGIPTVNLEYDPHRLVPARGVYATVVVLEGKPYPSVTNIGTRPTFYDQENVFRIESHILDFDHELYDQPLDIEFIRFLRPEQKFSTVDGLIAQIQIDIQRAREIFK